MKHSIRLIVLCVLTWFAGTVCLDGEICFAAGSQKETVQATESVEHLLAGLSDEQVRQLLIDELKKTSETEELSSPGQMKGPAFVLSRMLSKLSSGQENNKNQIATLLGFTPDVLPDLYKTFTML